MKITGKLKIETKKIFEVRHDAFIITSKNVIPSPLMCVEFLLIIKNISIIWYDYWSGTLLNSQLLTLIIVIRWLTWIRLATSVVMNRVVRVVAQGTRRDGKVFPFRTFPFSNSLSARFYSTFRKTTEWDFCFFTRFIVYNILIFCQHFEKIHILLKVKKMYE